MIRIVTDSTAHLPAELAAQLGVQVVPVYVNFGQESLKEGPELSVEAFYDRLSRDQFFPKTSQPSVGDFLEVYRPAHEAGDEIVSIHVAGKLSGTVASAHAAAEMLGDARISVVDSQSVSLGLGLQVIEAARAAAGGSPRQEIVRRVEEISGRINLIFVLDTLEYLRRGGRIGRGAALLGGLLNVKPLLEVRDGEVQPLERARSRRRALHRVQELVAERNPERRPLHLAVIHALAPEDAGQLEAQLRQAFPIIESYQAQIGAAVGAHAGPNAVGVAFWPD